MVTQEVSTELSAAVPAPAAHRSRDTGFGFLVLLTALLAFAPVAVLGSAFGWPASLSAPAGVQMSAIAGNPAALRLGYGLYLLYSLLIAPVMMGLAARTFGGLTRTLPALVSGFALLSVLARAIGIERWLSVMPLLAERYVGGDAATRVQTELLFDAITRYGGGIGELLGVSLLMAVSLALLCVGGLGRGAMPRLLAWGGLFASLLLFAQALPAFGIAAVVPISAAVSVLTLWMLGAAAWCLRAR
ncbi:DUF4386 family protein [Niveibacterium sp. SC-1]|uniref:DUF4386 family protein n=1 Tax=Niveibacterium sp. SC-1 TaxID=3135646 RepID=UPI00311FF838